MLSEISLWVTVVLATAYATYAVTDNDGPLNIFKDIRYCIGVVVDWFEARNRMFIAGKIESFETLMNCHVCLSPWIALLMMVLMFELGLWWLVTALAIAGVTVGTRLLFERLSAGAEG